MKRWLGREINIGKTKIMYTRAANETNIKFDGEPLAVIQRFTYLGSAVNERANLDCEIGSRINAASRAFWKLRERVFDNHDLSLTTKLAVYRAIVIPTLLYGCERAGLGSAVM